MESPSEIVTAFLARHTLDPLGFVRRAFPWGRGELAAFDGPEKAPERGAPPAAPAAGGPF